MSQSYEPHDYWVWGINPEPWRAPGVPKRGHAVSDGKTQAYKQALREELPVQNPSSHIWEGDLDVRFFFWRSTQMNMPADATNCQKATEDALQGLLYVNDKSNRHVSSVICEQTPTTYPCILIRIQYFEPLMHVPDQPPRREIGRFEGVSWQPPEQEMF